MPKVVVLLADLSANVRSLATAVADGCRSVRFTEVDLRSISLEGWEAGVRPLDALTDLLDYDGAVLCCDPAQLSAAVGALDSLLADKPAGFSEKVGAVAYTASLVVQPPREVQHRLLDLGMLVVPPSMPKRAAADTTDSASMQALGAHIGHRVAHAVEWVTHARHHHHH